MSATKVTTVYGLQAIIESVYNQGGTFTPATDAVLLAEPAVLSDEYLHMGERALSNVGGGVLSNTAPAGHQGEFPFKVEMKGFGAAYSVSNKPPDIDVALRASGHSATFGTDDWTYAPISDNASYESAALRFQSRGEREEMRGAYLDFGFVLDIGEKSFPIAEFTAMGSLQDPVEEAVSALTYLGAAIPPTVQAIGFTVGAYAGFKVRRVEFRKNLVRTARADMNAANGHGGFAVGRRDPRLIVTVEADTFANYNVWAKQKNGTEEAITFTVGSVAHNRFTFNAPQCTILGITKEDDDPIALWTIEYRVAATSGSPNNDYELVFD